MKSQGYHVHPLSRKEIQCRADMVRSLVGLNQRPYFDIVSFLENIVPVLDPEFHIKIVDDMELGENHAIAFPDRNLIVIKNGVYIGAINGSGRDRLTLAHEFGHIILHANVPIAYAQNRSGRKLRLYEDSEWQANVFAGQLLAPTYLIQSYNVQEIMNIFKVSHAAAETQLKVACGI